MSISLQKANLWKRISAYMFDAILAIMLAVGFATVFSAVFQYDAYTEQLNYYYSEYEEKYGIDLDITDEDYAVLSDAEKQLYTDANEAIGKDERIRDTFTTVLCFALAIISLGVLFSHLILYFAIPLFFKNGQTLGKKIFGIAVMRTNCVKITNFVLFVRSVFGLYLIETMFPVLLLVMIYFGVMGGVGTITIGLLLLLQLVVMVVTQTNSSIHDLLSDTVVVDFASQQIFDTEAEMIAYKEELHRQEVEAQKEQTN